MNTQISPRSYHIDGLACEGCAESAQKVAGALPEVDAAQVSFETRTLSVTGAVTESVLSTAMADAGYPITPKQ